MTDKEKPQNVEINIGERFLGGYCGFYNTPLQNLESCKPCVYCGRSEASGEFVCRMGAHMYP